jgi:hypothetical protein
MNTVRQVRTARLAACLAAACLLAACGGKQPPPDVSTPTPRPAQRAADERTRMKRIQTAPSAEQTTSIAEEAAAMEAASRLKPAVRTATPIIAASPQTSETATPADSTASAVNVKEVLDSLRAGLRPLPDPADPAARRQQANRLDAAWQPLLNASNSPGYNHAQRNMIREAYDMADHEMELAVNAKTNDDYMRRLGEAQTIIQKLEENLAPAGKN